MAEDVEPDAALMLRVREGDTSAFTELVNRYKQPVINLVSRMLQDPGEAEDIAQNVFVQAFRSAPRYKVSAKFSTWLFTIARNLCLNELRRRARHRTESMDASPAQDPDSPTREHEDRGTATPPAALLHGELQDLLAESLRDLPETQRMAVLLCREEDLSYEEIAKIMGTSLSATKSLIFRGRETLKRRLKPYLKTGEWEK